MAISMLERSSEAEEQESESEVVYPLVPRDYQQVGIEFLRSKRRALLTDKAGLGKTLEASEAAERPVLVVAPTYLVEQWYEFLTQQYPNDKVSLARGSRRKRNVALKRKADWYIVNVQMLRSYNMPTQVKTIIFDEAHHLRNPRALQSKSAAKLAKDPSLRIYELTATPIWKQADNLWMLLHMLQPRLFHSYNEFVKLFCVVDEDPWEGIKVLGIKKSMRRELEMLLDVVRLGRTYEQVGRFLPPIITHNVKVDFPKDLREKYDELRETFRIQLLEDESLLLLSHSAVMHTLRQLTAFPGKVDATLDIIEDNVDKQLVVFCWYKDTAEHIANKIKAKFRGKRVELITGDVKPDERRVRAGQADIAVATIASLSEGVNLWHMRAVVFFEENWPPGSNYQALSRVRRDRNDEGQDREPVIVYYVHVRKTIDEVIHRVTKKREATMRDVMREILE